MLHCGVFGYLVIFGLARYASSATRTVAENDLSWFSDSSITAACSDLGIVIEQGFCSSVFLRHAVFLIVYVMLGIT